MHVTVLGATGKIGRVVVECLSGDGTRSPCWSARRAKLALSHPALYVRVGQLSDADAVRDTIAGADAVISVLGLTQAWREGNAAFY